MPGWPSQVRACQEEAASASCGVKPASARAVISSAMRPWGMEPCGVGAGVDGDARLVGLGHGGAGAAVEVAHVRGVGGEFGCAVGYSGEGVDVDEGGDEGGAVGGH